MTPVRRETQIMGGTSTAQIANANSIGQMPGRRWSRMAISESTLKKSVSGEVEAAAMTWAEINY